MLLRSYPVICTSEVAAASDFWRERFGFTTTFEADWYVSLRHQDSGAEIAFLDAHHETVPAAYRQPVAGLIINLEVDDVDAWWQRLVIDAGLEAVLEIRSEEFGQRHFIIAGPAGLLIDVITEIEPSPEFAAAFE